MSERVVLVDAADAEIGTEDKLAAHRAGRLHRAFSVFVFNGRGEMLLQRRASSKYHSGGLWSNTCCSHPRPGEATPDAAHRRLFEEMGIRCELRPAFAFIYRADVGGGLIEHEYDHLFIGRWDGDPEPDLAEVEAWRWATPAAVRRELRRHPRRFTFWFRVAMGELATRDLLAS